MPKRIVALTVNGRRREDAVDDATLLLDHLREQLALTGTKRGCDGGECGACTVLVDGEPVLACLTLAARCEGKRVETIEALAVNGRMAALQAAFHEQARHAVRLLHAGHDHGCRGAAAPRPRARRGRDPRGAGRQPVPLHRLRQDHRVGAGRRGGRHMTREPAGVAVGVRQPLIDGIEKVTGRARYTADLPAPGALVGAILRSPAAHARIRGIDVSAARAMPGVAAVVTGEDCDIAYGVIPIAQNEFPLARERVRYRGEPVAAVAAVDAATARAALDAIVLDLEPLPAYFDAAASRAPDAVLLHANKPGNVEREVEQAFGDPDAGFGAADLVREQRFHYAEVTHAMMEPNAALAEWDAERGRLTLHSVTQVPYYVHLALARCLALDESAIRVVKPFVGGGFGHRTETLNFEIVAALLARAAGGTVKLELSREESFLTHRGRPETDIRMKIGMQADGTITAFDAEVVQRGGAYAGLRSGHDPLRRRAAARALPRARVALPRLPRLREHAAERRDARPRLGRRAPRVRVDARPDGRRARPRPLRGAPREPHRAAVAHDQRPAGQLLRPRRVPRPRRARVGLARAARQAAARARSRHGVLALRQRLGEARALDRRAARRRAV